MSLEISLPLEGSVADGADHHLRRRNVILFEMVVELLLSFVVSAALHAAEAEATIAFLPGTFICRRVVLEVVLVDDFGVIF